MLSDYLVFWMRHNELPAFEADFDQFLYEVNCSVVYVQVQMFKKIMEQLGISLTDAAKGLESLEVAVRKASEIKRGKNAY